MKNVNYLNQLNQLSYMAIKFPMTKTSFMLPVFDVFIALILAFPIDIFVPIMLFRFGFA